MTSLRLAWTLVIGVLHIATGVVLVAAFPVLPPSTRLRIVRWWSRCLLAICRVRLRVVAPLPNQTPHASLVVAALAPGRVGAMLLLNHVSWLDIFVVQSLRPAHFIAKAEIARWPVLGFLTSRTGALFIERGKRHAVRETNHRAARLLTDGGLVCMFPEGTTSDGNRLLPFHGNLIQPAIDAGKPVIVGGLRYRDRHGHASAATLYTGDIDLLRSLLRIVRGGPVFAELRLIDAIETASVTRHAIARQARIAITDALGFDDLAHEAIEGLATMIVVPDASPVSRGFAPTGMEPGTLLDPRDELL